jgi:hypothetical protein
LFVEEENKAKFNSLAASEMVYKPQNKKKEALPF